MAVITVIHFAKVSALYPRVVISSLRGRLEKPLFAILTLPLVHGPKITTCCYKRFALSRMPGLAMVVRGTIAMLRFLGVVRGTTAPLAPSELERMTMPLPTHPSKAHFPQHP
jgi:hypothetical protein